MKLFGGIFDPAIRIATGDPRGEWLPGAPEEEAALARAVPARRREFRAGRAVAREAMRALGVEPVAVPAAPDRAPLWPQGIVGSISHCRDLCAAALGRRADGFVSIGLDIEPAEALDPDLVSTICVDEERDWLAAMPEAERGILARTIFSAKECAYKCQYTLSRQLLDFHAMTIRIDAEGRRFVAEFNATAGPFATGDRLDGRFSIDAGHIVTGMALTGKQIASSRPDRDGGGDEAVARYG